MKCEVLTESKMFHDGANMLAAMVKAAPIPIVTREVYSGDCDLLMCYGLGHPQRRPWWLGHIASGRHAVGFDLGYWREAKKLASNRPMRMTVDADHPQRWLDDRPPTRFDAAQLRLRNDYVASGPIVIVGLGVKTTRMLGVAVTDWEHDALNRIRAVYPNTPVVYRPKNEDGTNLPGTRKMAGMPIEQVLRGASLVVCRHSNVAVDACLAGIPVVCEDGAASILYGNSLKQPVNPTYEQRLHFLRNLAWWQWRPSEAAQCWNFLLKRIEEHDRVTA